MEGKINSRNMENRMKMSKVAAMILHKVFIWCSLHRTLNPVIQSILDQRV